MSVVEEMFELKKFYGFKIDFIFYTVYVVNLMKIAALSVLCSHNFSQLSFSAMSRMKVKGLCVGYN